MKHLISLFFLSAFCVINASFSAPEFPMVSVLVFLILGVFLQLLDLEYFEKKGKSLPAWIPATCIILEIIPYSSVLKPVFGIPLLTYSIRRRENMWISGLSILTLGTGIPIGNLVFLLVSTALSLWLSSLISTSEAAIHEQTAALDKETGRRLRLMREKQLLIEKHEIERESERLSERNRIARDIHDKTGHKLSSAILQVHALRLQQELLATTSTAPAPCLQQTQTQELDTLESTLQNAMTEIRESVHALYQSSLQLRNKIERIAEEYRFCPVYWTCNIESEPNAGTYQCLVSIIQEALNNTAKHSNADRIDISLKEGVNDYFLIIEDNGNTPVRNAVPGQADGIGLANMENRVKELQGTLHISHEKGFRIFVRIPKPFT